MSPPYNNSSSSPFPFELNNEDHDHHQNHTLNFSTPNFHVASSSSHSHLFYYPLSDPQFYNQQIQPQKVDNHARKGGSSYDQGPKTKITLWKNNNKEENYDEDNNKNPRIIPAKWMSSKMRVMQKMKSSDRAAQAMASVTTAAATTTVINTNTNTKIIEDQKRASPSLESEHSSNSSSNYSTSNNVPIRVCSDCNTTKTPLWRSGPKGPKSLCNACGIRQRKARRAMAAAAAAAALTTEASSSSSLKIKVKATKVAKINNVNDQHVTPFKKRCKIVATTNTVNSRAEKEINGLEDFLINLSKNYSAYHHVFPQDEKDAAILLMAISCGLVHS